MSVDWLDILANSSTVTNLQTNVLDNERELYYSEILYEYFPGKFSIWLKNHMQNADMCTRRSKRRCMQGVMISFKYNNDTYNRFFQSFDFIIPVTELLVDLIDIKWWHIYLKSVSDFNVMYLKFVNDQLNYLQIQLNLESIFQQIWGFIVFSLKVLSSQSRHFHLSMLEQ